MRKTFIFSWLFLCILFSLLSGVPAAAQTDAPQAPANSAPLARDGQLEYRPGAVLVGMMAGKGAEQPRLSQALPIEGEIPALALVRVQVEPGTEETALASLRAEPGVAFAELDYRAHAALMPDDPDWTYQWSLGRISAPIAWGVTQGVSTTVIALLDSGVALEHPDLKGKLWQQPGEIAGNAIDDDNDGRVDNVYGWHFSHDWNGSEYVASEDGNVQDDYGHGTHVAGIAAAATNNGTGIAGVAPQASIMPVKVLDQYGSGWYSDIAAGIIYATDKGAQIINLSLGGAAPSNTLCSAVAYARSKGSLVVAAAGNAGGSVLFPAACEQALAVAATGQQDQHPDFSNVGPEVDVAAPGVNIYSTWYEPNLQTNGYYTLSGTSMATPHVAGLAALIWAKWPDWTPDQVATQILTTAADRGEPGWDPAFGWGRIDAARALVAREAQSVHVIYLPQAAGN